MSDKNESLDEESLEMIGAEESFIVDVQINIQWLLNDKGMTQADLARALNVSEARVSRLFGDDARNLTLRTIARIFKVMGERCRVTSPRLEELIAQALKGPSRGKDSEVSVSRVMSVLGARDQWERIVHNDTAETDWQEAA